MEAERISGGGSNGPDGGQRWVSDKNIHIQSPCIRGKLTEAPSTITAHSK